MALWNHKEKPARLPLPTARHAETGSCLSVKAEGPSSQAHIYALENGQLNIKAP